VLDASHLSVAGLARLFVGDVAGAAARLEDSVVAHRNVPGRSAAWYPLLWLAATLAATADGPASDTLREARAELADLPDPAGIWATMVELVAAAVDLGPDPRNPARRPRAGAVARAHAHHPHQDGSIDHRLALRLLTARLGTR
jgi:hypothetical protein